MNKNLRGPMCGETNPCWSRTPGPTGINDSADRNNRVTIPWGPCRRGKGGHKEAGSPRAAGRGGPPPWTPAMASRVRCRASGPLHVQLDVHSTPIHIYIFVDHPGSEAKARGLESYFRRMPPVHVQNALAHFPIFIIKDKPDTTGGGGTWIRRNVRRAFWGLENITCVPNADLERLILVPRHGLIGIPMNRWHRPLNWVVLTVMHEAGHAVDSVLNLHDGCTAAQFRGVRPACRGPSEVVRHSVEAYARFILGRRNICRDLPHGESDAECNRRVIGHLRRTPAFRSVPAGWMPGRSP